MNKKNSLYINKTFNFYKNISNNNWRLEFKDFPKVHNDSYGLQLQIHALPLDNFLNEEYLLYKIDVLFKGAEPKEDKSYIKYICIFVPIGAIILGVALFFLIKFFKLKKKNKAFEKEVKSLLFSKDIQKNVLIKEQQISKNESDFETTFI